MKQKRRGLGKDLTALLGASAVKSEETITYKDDELQDLPINQIKVSPYQPRRHFDESSLQELAQSISAQGLIQPIVVRPLDSGDYELIAGERRLRACKLIEKTTIKAIVRPISNEAAMAMALIENIQRDDLNPIEEATALERLISEFEMTHQQVADAVGRSRTAVTNLLRLLGLSFEVKILLEDGDIDMGHARALLPLSSAEQAKMAKKIVDLGLSVRETENMIRGRNQSSSSATGSNSKGNAGQAPIDPDVLALENRLADRLGASVKIKHNPGGRGRLVIDYHSIEELEGILEHIGA